MSFSVPLWRAVVADLDLMIAEPGRTPAVYARLDRLGLTDEETAHFGRVLASEDDDRRWCRFREWSLSVVLLSAASDEGPTNRACASRALPRSRGVLRLVGSSSEPVESPAGSGRQETWPRREER